MNNNISFKKFISLLGVVALLQSLFFINVYADTTVNTAPFIGVNVQVTGVDQDINGIQFPKVNFTYSSGSVPAGYVSGQLNCTTWRAGSSNDGPCDIYQFQNASGQGGNLSGLRLVLPLEQYILAPQGSGVVTSAYNYIFDYEFILDDNYRGYVVLNNTFTIYVNGNSFHHSIRQQGITQQEFTISDYSLVRVTEPVQWAVPVESLMPIKYISEQNVEIKDFIDNDYWTYPIFEISTDDNVAAARLNAGQSYYFIFYIEKTINGDTAFNNTFSLPNNASYSDGFIINRAYFGSKYYTIYRATITSTTTQNVIIKYIGTDNINFIPIYFNVTSFKYVSNDFALHYGLSNKLLDDINLLANGNVKSNNDVNELESATSDMNDSRDDLLDIEDSFNSDMNNSLNNIPSFSIETGFGSKFLNSAQWVRTQFENLTSSNPYGSLLSFSLLLGLSLLIIGRIWG